MAKDDNHKRLPVPLDPGWTPIPHQMIRHLYYFTPPEGMVLLVAYDITVGWHRAQPQPMSYRWVAEQTGLSVNTVQKAIAGLILKGWIVESKKRGKRGVKLYKPVTRAQNLGYDLHNEETTVSNSDTVTVSNSDTVPYQELIRHKESTPKESTKKKKEHAREVDAVFDQPVFTHDSRHALRVWREAGNGPDAWLSDKGRAQVMHDALKRFTIQQVCDALRFASKDQYQQGRLGSMHAVRDNIGIWVKMLAPGGSRAAQTFNRPDLLPFEDSDPGAGMILDQDGLE